MGGEHGIERRRQPRWTVSDAVDCRLEVRRRVQLVDISASGVLFVADSPVSVGAAGHLRAGIAPAFSAAVQIRRIACTGRRSLAVGASFLSMDDHSRRSLENLLKITND